MLVVNDPDMVKSILVRDAHNFSDTNPFRKIFIRYLSSSFIMKKNKEWKDGRNLVSPVFTTRKIKEIFQQFQKASKPLFSNIEDLIEQGRQDEIDVKDLMKNYQLDVIAKFVYSLDLNSAKDLDHPFVKNVRKLIDFQDKKINIFFSLWPAKLIKLFDIQFFDGSALEYLANVTRVLIKQRNETQNRENYDFLGLLINTIREKELNVPEEEIIGNCTVSARSPVLHWIV